MTPEEVELVLQYGTCQTCGAARCARSTRLGRRPDGVVETLTELMCAADPDHDC